MASVQEPMPPLLRLPPELRAMIFKHIHPLECRELVASCYEIQATPFREVRALWQPARGELEVLAQVNRQIRAEIKDLTTITSGVTIRTRLRQGNIPSTTRSSWRESSSPEEKRAWIAEQQRHTQLRGMAIDLAFFEQLKEIIVVLHHSFFETPYSDVLFAMFSREEHNLIICLRDMLRDWTSDSQKTLTIILDASRDNNGREPVSASFITSRQLMDRNLRVRWDILDMLVDIREKRRVEIEPHVNTPLSFLEELDSQDLLPDGVLEC